MGYYSNYRISYYCKPGHYIVENKIVNALAEINPNYFGDFKDEDCGLEDLFYEEMKWYDCKYDMIALSLKFPDVLFILDVVGEESYDIWRALYMNGAEGKTITMISFSNLTWSEDPGDFRDLYESDLYLNGAEEIDEKMIPIENFLAG